MIRFYFQQDHSRFRVKSRCSGRASGQGWMDPSPFREELEGLDDCLDVIGWLLMPVTDIGAVDE